jgi:hypothetical protein
MKEAHTELKKRYLAINLIGLVMIGSVFLYVVIVEVIKRVFAPFAGFATVDNNTANLIKYVFIFLTFANYFIIKAIQKKILTQSLTNLPQAAIITFAFCESVAVFGLVLFLLTGSTLDFYTFFAVSLFFFYIFYPRYEQWEKLLSSEGSPPPNSTS